MIGSSVFAQQPQGFFIKNQPAKKAVLPAYTDLSAISAKPTVNITVDYQQIKGKVSDYLYGNNTNPYMTDIVSQPALIKHIQTLSPNILRYPGGNISNVFFWNAAPGNKPADVPDTIGYGDKRVKRPERFWYGKNESKETLSVEKYYQTLKATNSTGLICVNYSYARYSTSKNPVQKAAHLAADWVRYDKGRTKFWEIGNENFGTWQAGYAIDTTKNKDHQPKIISGKIYGEHFNVFVDSMKAAAKEVGTSIQIGVVMIEAPKEKSWEGGIEKDWNSGLLKAIGNKADFFIVHNYYTPYDQNSSATTILNTATTETQKMVAYLKQLSAEHQVALKPVALTEWNIFANGSKQSCSYINGMHAAIVLGELAEQQYGLAARWDLANGYAKGNDHGMFNKGDEPGVPLWNPRPAYYYMYYFQKFFGDQVLNSKVENSNEILTYASRFSSGEVGLVVVNKGTTPQTVNLNIKNFNPKKRYYLYTLTGGDDNGEFSQKVIVNGHVPAYQASGPADLESIKALSAKAGGQITIQSMGRAVQYILISKN